MTEVLSEKRKRASTSGEESEQPVQKKTRRSNQLTEVPGLTEDEALDGENDRQPEERRSFFQKQKVSTLVGYCARNTLKKGGKKEELVQRLLDHFHPELVTPVKPSSSPMPAGTAEQKLLPAPALTPSPAHSFVPENRSSAQTPTSVNNDNVLTPTATPVKLRKLKSAAKVSVPNAQACSQDLQDHPRRQGPLQTDLGTVRRYYPSQARTMAEQISTSLHQDAQRFKKDLADLAPEQIELSYCLLAQRVQSLAHNTIPCLDLKDKKALAEAERSESAFMAMDILEQNAEMMASLNWHHMEVQAQRKVMADQAEHIKKVETERVHDANHFNEKQEQVSKRLAEALREKEDLEKVVQGFNDAGTKDNGDEMEANETDAPSGKPITTASTTEDGTPQNGSVSEKPSLPSLSVVPDSQNGDVPSEETTEPPTATTSTPNAGDEQPKSPTRATTVIGPAVEITVTTDDRATSIMNSPGSPGPEVQASSPTSTPATTQLSTEPAARAISEVSNYDDDEDDEDSKDDEVLGRGKTEDALAEDVANSQALHAPLRDDEDAESEAP
ncbi:MAG: hypothetical protein Q9162_001300 [Coniocarpon cinnabarinum]